MIARLVTEMRMYCSVGTNAAVIKNDLDQHSFMYVNDATDKDGRSQLVQHHVVFMKSCVHMCMCAREV